jgi:hypothetical protein
MDFMEKVADGDLAGSTFILMLIGQLLRSTVRGPNERSAAGGDPSERLDTDG